LEFAYRDIVARYLPARYAGRLTLLVPEDDWSERAWSIAGWKAVAPQLEIMKLPGEHLTCITTFVDETASRINRLLQIERPPAGPPTSISQTTSA
jgi:thioesterase domain-containing protein